MTIILLVRTANEMGIFVDTIRLKIVISTQI